MLNKRNGVHILSKFSNFSTRGIQIGFQAQHPTGNNRIWTQSQKTLTPRGVTILSTPLRGTLTGLILFAIQSTSCWSTWSEVSLLSTFGEESSNYSARRAARKDKVKSPLGVL